MASALKQSRRQRLDEEYRSLNNSATGEVLCQYGPSLITVIFNVQTIVDATLFFIAGAHERYKVRPTDEIVLQAKFVNPRIPTFFSHLLPSSESITAQYQQHKKPTRRQVAAAELRQSRPAQQRARKRCAFFNLLITRRGRDATEPPVVNIAADVKLFHYTAHVCGLRDARDAELVMRVIHEAFVENQARLEEGDLELPEGTDAEVRAFLESNTRCCTVPLVISEGDVVMTNICGRFPKSLNLRLVYYRLTENYPGVLAYLTTMSKSNYLAITLFEEVSLTTQAELTATEVREIKESRYSYLISSKKLRSKSRKHTFFVYASGRFIQSSRNNAASLIFTENCMKILHDVSLDLEAPLLAEEEESESSEDETSLEI